MLVHMGSKMKRKIDPIEREIDKIRVEIYEETKGMTPEEFNEYIRKSTEATIKEYGIKLVASK